MKRIIFAFAAIALFSLSLLAQTQKGNFYFGITGSGSNIFDTENSNSTSKATQTVYNFSTGVNAGYLIKDKFALGINANYNSSLNITPVSTLLIKKNLFWFAPISIQLHARKYFMFQPNFGIYPQLSGGIVTGLARDMVRLNNDDVLLLAEGSLSGYTSNIGMGIMWFPFKKFKRLNIETFINVLGYSAITTTYKAPSTRAKELKTSFHFFNTSVGINYYIFKQDTSE